MNFPTPRDMSNAPGWDNYVVAQAIQASLGLIPYNALAIGVLISEHRIELLFQLSELTIDDEEDMSDVTNAFEMLTGWVVPVSHLYQILRERDLASAPQNTRWIYLHRNS